MVGNTKKNRNHATHWTLTEIAFLEKHYGKLPAKEIAIPQGRGVTAVRAMALKVGVGRSGAKPWEPWEIGVVKKYYSHGEGIAMVRALLPHHDKDSIRKQAGKAGLTDVREWDPDVIAFLIKHYGHMPVEEVAAALNKSVSAVRNRANILKLGKMRLRKWTREENAAVIENYGDSGNLDAIHTLLPHRSKSAISAQANKLGLRRAQAWTPGEISILKQFYLILGRKVLPVALQRVQPQHHQDPAGYSEPMPASRATFPG